MKKILLTGGAGFIGSHTCVELLNKGCNVCIVDSLVNSSEKIIAKIIILFLLSFLNIVTAIVILV